MNIAQKTGINQLFMHVFSQIVIKILTWYYMILQLDLGLKSSAHFQRNVNLTIVTSTY